MIHRDALFRKAYHEVPTYIRLQAYAQLNVSSDNVLQSLARACHVPV